MVVGRALSPLGQSKFSFHRRLANPSCEKGLPEGGGIGQTQADLIRPAEQAAGGKDDVRLPRPPGEARRVGQLGKHAAVASAAESPAARSGQQLDVGPLVRVAFQPPAVRAHELGQRGRVVGFAGQTDGQLARQPVNQAAEAAGIGETYYRTHVAVFQGPEGDPGGKSYPDPYYGGEGPDRTTCNGCGGCMVGCRFNAKNSLDKNYLYFAEKNGARIFAGRGTMLGGVAARKPVGLDVEERGGCGDASCSIRCLTKAPVTRPYTRSL